MAPVSPVQVRFVPLPLGVVVAVVVAVPVVVPVVVVPVGVVPVVVGPVVVGVVADRILRRDFRLHARLRC